MSRHSETVAAAMAAQRRAEREYALLMADYARNPGAYAHAAWNDCAYGCTDPRTCEHYARHTYKADGMTYVHKSLSAAYAQTPLCGFIADGETLHSDLAYVTCPDCLVAS
jgi:hypothetical protein